MLKTVEYTHFLFYKGTEHAVLPTEESLNRCVSSIPVERNLHTQQTVRSGRSTA